MDKHISSKSTLNNNDTNISLSPFHRGEHELQTRTGQREKMESIGKRVVRSYMPDQHRDFFTQLPFVIIGSVDHEGWPWASILAGNAGFITSPTSTSLEIKNWTINGDPLAESLNKTGTPLGFLGIELSTRRRNRVNGRVSMPRKNKITVNIDQSFGNCPQYIQYRSVTFIRDVEEVGQQFEKQSFTTLDNKARTLINAADTFFVSSYIQSKEQPTIEGVDVSHRGGRPGFIKIEGNTLTIPDYPGNNLFNTLGNFIINPKGGLTFIDFTTGELLMLTGAVELLWEENEDIKAFKGAERSWKFTLHHGIRLKDALPFRATLGDFSPNTLMTGTWKETATIIENQAKQDQWQTFKVSQIIDESEDIRSFYLKPADKASLPLFKAGQYLTIKIPNEPNKKSLIRTYTISSAPGESYYRISVKKEPNGIVSTRLHNHLKQNDEIEIKAPRGDFYINSLEKRPAVLIAAGVGITPMISMALHVYNESIRMRQLRPLTIIHAAKTSNSRAFSSEFKKLQDLSNKKIRYISFLSKPSANEKAGVDFNGNGRITASTYKQALPLDNYDFFLCGPSAFMQSQYDVLSELGIQDSRIFAEAFGPASIKRTIDTAVPSESKTPLLQEDLEASISMIKFTKSKFEQPWSKGDKTILETAEDHGLSPEFSCRDGKCGACATPLLSGEVTYRHKPSVLINKNEVLICCAVPAKNSKSIEIIL
jgi:ferredoxin-NADP reductase/predicted pyridoxine 5'-phosphate oxidase superfamily flavin-nucleotide-binding protein